MNLNDDESRMLTHIQNLVGKDKAEAFIGAVSNPAAGDRLPSVLQFLAGEGFGDDAVIAVVYALADPAFVGASATVEEIQGVAIPAQGSGGSRARTAKSDGSERNEGARGGAVRSPPGQARHAYAKTTGLGSPGREVWFIRERRRVGPERTGRTRDPGDQRPRCVQHSRYGNCGQARPRRAHGQKSADWRAYPYPGKDRREVSPGE